MAELEKLAGEHSGLRDAAVVAETEVRDLEREQKRADAEVEQVRARKDRDQKRLESGQVGSPKELENLQSEIASLDRRQGVLEDAELAIMERLDEAQRRLDDLVARRDELGQRGQALKRARDGSWAEIDKDAEFAQRQRAALVDDIPDDLLSLYDKIRADRDGIGAAALRRRRCEGCRMELDPVEIARIRGLAPDVVVRHDECRRILVRTPESGL